MDDFTIIVEDRGDISVEVENNIPNVSLLPSAGSINVHNVTRDLYIIDEEYIGNYQLHDEITEEEANILMDNIDNENGTT